MTDIQLGDHIRVELGNGFGSFSATLQRVMDNSYLFLFDQIITRYPMNKINTNDGGYDASDMKHWLRNIILPSFPIELYSNIVDITLPTYGQIFGHGNELLYWDFEPDDDEQFELMKRKMYHIRYFNDDWCSWWLRNATKKEVSASSFACVSYDGYESCFGASNSRGVCPEFYLAK